MGDYYLGLDLGTSSIGWAVTDENYKLMRARGKDLWGVHKFTEGKSAKDRRVQRSSRRRTARRRARMELLREFFEEEIFKIDPDFFKRLDESKFWKEDKEVEGKYALFNDPNYTDQQYFDQYPTIFHLRKELMENDEKKDIRLYFLALNQLMKRRGHFLLEGQSISSVEDVEPLLLTLRNLLEDEPFEVEGLEIEDLEELIDFIRDRSLGVRDKTSKITALAKELGLDKTRSDKFKDILNALVYGEFRRAARIFDLKEDEVDGNKIVFTSEDFDEVKDDYEQVLGPDMAIVETIKGIYDYITLQEILDGENSLSNAQVKRYEKHAADLAKLKNLVRKHDVVEIVEGEEGEEDKKRGKYYWSIFVDPRSKGKNYANYVGFTNINGKKISLDKSSYEDFIEWLEKELEKFCSESDEEYQEILKDIEKENFLQKQIVNTNSAIPYQVHQIELERIVANLVKNYPSFDVEEDGYTKGQKIEKLFRFRIPYYVGPLNPAHKDKRGSNTWIVKNPGHEDTPVRPWNFDEVVNKAKCEKEFIDRLIGRCTYLPDEKVVPKQSIMYSKYEVLNELNNLRINGELITVELKQGIFNDLFCKYKNVTNRRLIDYLIRSNYVDSKPLIEGIDQNFKSSMTSYLELAEILGEAYDEQMAEDLIYWITVHVGNREAIEENVREAYPVLADDVVRKLSTLKYQAWGRFSEKFLKDFPGASVETGEENSILNFLYETNHNLMELLSKNYTFRAELDEYQSRVNPSEITHDMLEELYISPAVRKMVWRTLKLIDELVSVLGREPRKIFIEMARAHDASPERTDSRKQRFLDLYSNIKSEERDWIEEISKYTDQEFKVDKLYLYYEQMGRCMYSGESISLSQLFDDYQYDIDHIIPRSLRKDDSIRNNLVLVKRDLNQRVKGDKYPVPEILRESGYKLWNSLYYKGLISKAKYGRLIRHTPLSYDEMADFINRQLVETRQSSKVVANLLSQGYEDSRVVYVKAGNVNDFRRVYKLVKERDLNDLHHAHDALLTIISGNEFDKEFTSNPRSFIEKNRGRYSLNHIFEERRRVNGKWKWFEKPELKRAIVQLDRFSPLITYSSFADFGKIAHDTLSRADKINTDLVHLPLKKEDRLKDVEKYGGYTNIFNSSFFLMSYKSGRKRQLRIESIPVYLVLENGGTVNEEILENYCVKVLGFEDPRIFISRILKYSIVVLNGFKYLLASQHDKTRLNLITFEQSFWTMDHTKIISKLNRAYKKISESNDRYLFDQLTIDEIMFGISLMFEKMQKPPFKYKLKADQITEDNFGDLKSLSKEEQLFLFNDLLNLTKPGSKDVNLSRFGLQKVANLTTLNKNITNVDSLVLTHQSITGLYERKVDLKELWDGEQL